MTTFVVKREAEQSPTDQTLPVKSLVPHPMNPRADARKSIDGLAASVADIGLLAPIIVRPAPNGKFQVLAGERRLRAAEAAGQKTVRCTVRSCNDQEALIIMVRENADREPLTLPEQGKAFANLTLPIKQGGAGMTIAAIAERFKIPPATVSVLVGIVSLPDWWQERIVDAEFSLLAAKALVRVADDATVLDACRRDFETQTWAWRSGRDVERSVETIREKIRGGKPERPADDRPIVAPARPKAQPVAPAANDEPHDDDPHDDDEPVSVGRPAAKPAPRPLPLPSHSAAIAHGDREDLAEPRAEAGDRFADLRDHEFFGVLAPFLGDRRALEAIGNLALRLAVRTGGAR